MRFSTIVISTILFLSGTAQAQNVVRRPATVAADSARFVEDEFVVVFKNGIGRPLTGANATGRLATEFPSIDARLRRNGVTKFRRQFPDLVTGPQKTVRLGIASHFKAQIMPGADLETAIADFASDPNVDHVEKIGIHPVYLEPNDTYYDNPPAAFPYNAWHIKQSLDHDIDGNLAWDLETGDATVVVGILDSGVRYIHGDLGGSDPPGPGDATTNGNVWVNTEETPGNGIDDDGNGYVDDVIGYDFVSTGGPDQCASNQGEDCTNPDNDPADFNGHGTAVAGCVAAITNNGAGVVGVAGGYRNGTPFGGVPGVKVMCLRVGWHGRDGNGYVRMDFAAEAINYAVQKKLDGHNIAALNCSWGTSNSGGIDAAVNLALANDIMVIHAAGNGGNNSPDYMGNKVGVMNVGATDSTDTRTSFSDFGSWVDCAAPGEDIISTYHAFDDPINDYVVVISGTSFSSPIACGVAALLESYDPSLSATDKFTIMVTSGDDIGNQNVGLRLNARSALDSANPCVDVSAPSTTLLTPNGGDSIAAGTFADITWNATDDCGIADVEIRLDRGDDGVYEELIALLPGNPGTYSWSVTGPATATARIQVAATDGLAQTGSDQSDQTFTITQNQAPVLAPLSPQVVAEADTLSFPVSASDPDLDSITLFAFSLPTNATFADNGDGTGTVEFSPDFSQAGDYTIIFVASDGALSDTDSTTVTVTNTNRPPVFDPAGPQSVDEGQMLIVPLSASDPDSDALTLAAVSLPPNALLSDNGDGTGAIDFQPDFSQAGSVNLIIRVTDGTDADTLSIPTTVHNVNRSPVASPVDSQFVDEGQVLILPVGGTDVDGDSLVLDLVPLPTNAVFVDHGDGTGELTFSPDYDQAGEYPLQMFVTDLDLSDTVAFNIRVADALPPCACDCHSDPVCDSVINVLDVVQLIEVAFRGGTDVLDPSPTCPFVTTDLNCDGQTNVLDAVVIVDVAFRGGDPNASICDPCL